MFSIFNKRRMKSASPQWSRFVSKTFYKLRVKMSNYLRKQEKKIKPKRKIMILAIFCVLIVSIHVSKLYQLNTVGIERQQLPSHQKFSTPLDISLPDSLDIDLINQYRELQKKQDSLQKSKPE